METLDNWDDEFVIISEGDVMGDTPHYRVTDVAELLQSRFVILTGGKALNGAPIVTFPDRQGAPDVSDEDYKKVVTYLCNLVPLHEAESGFILIIDRRQDGWGAVRSILLKISTFFPVHIQVVFLLQPRGFFQRAFADLRSKFVKEELEFKVVLCDAPSEMGNYIDPLQLTTDLGGELEFDTLEWTEHRSAVEKFAQNADNMSTSFNKAVKRFQELELPNAVHEVEAMVRCCLAERKELMDDFNSFTTHGNTLLGCIKGDNATTPLVKLCHVVELERLLVQLDETKGNFEEFWTSHERRMRQALHLRKFEDDFKLVQFGLGVRIETLEEQMTEMGSSVAQVESLAKEFEKIEEESQKDLEQGDRMRLRCDQLMMEDQYAVDSMRPKCVELQRMCEQYKELLRRRRQMLTRSHDLHDRLERANRWCSSGVDLLAGQPLERCQTSQGAEIAVQEIDAFLKTLQDLKLSNPREFRQLFEDLMTQETRGTVQQVLKRMEDVQSMCEKRKESLRKMFDSRSRPVQLVNPALVVPPHSPSHLDETDGFLDLKRKTSDDASRKSHSFLEKSARLRPDIRHSLPAIVHDNISTSAGSSIAASDSSTSDIHMGSEGTQRTSLSSLSSFPESDSLQAKSRHVMNELIDTEKVYVAELQEILEGYYNEMDNRASQHLIPDELAGQKNILFGNLVQIYKFHKDQFLQELQDCRDMPAKVGKCFVNRKEEFQMYSIYCQNKPRSEALRMRVGDSNPFFKECQQRLGHKLPLGAYLLKPVQRITKYQLLLKEMLRFTDDDRELRTQLQEALDTMLSVLRYLNASMHQVHIIGFNENLPDQGKLLMHGSFSVWMEHKHDRIRDLRFKAMQRHLFLYERSLLLCKKKEENNEEPVYTFKNKLKLSQVGLTEKLKGDKRKFELWSKGREEVVIIQAPTMEVKEVWVKEIKRVLMNQFDQIKSHRKTFMPLSYDGSSSTSQLSSDSSEYSLDNWQPPIPAINNNNNNVSTLPVGLEMISPVTSPCNPMPCHPLPLAQDSGDTPEDEEGWSSGEFSNEEENPAENYIPNYEPSYRQQFVSLGDYVAVDGTELSLKEGEVLEILRVGNNGWWYAHSLTTETEGWVPSTYLDPVPTQHLSTHSSSGNDKVWLSLVLAVATSP
ncbi:hypothetical protein C0Q70_21186 [Pomacea canaliculata]|uniref:Guanine nucleotide exchange factor DBS n=1 Tax=Pomacea canaliculata TaxID=400727 RepID=A0A2T7NBT0_POMCA|nr:hypothetical protein C0Q70_21186 [Pomacea canaliculata]